MDVFAFSSHHRARDALDFGLKIAEPGFNIFVLGEDRTGRMAATLSYLQQNLGDLDRQTGDWIYVNNFKQSHRPISISLPPGMGRKFKRDMDDFVMTLQDVLTHTFSSDGYKQQINLLQSEVQSEIDGQMSALKSRANNMGFDIVPTQEGMAVVKMDGAGKDAALDKLSGDLMGVTTRRRKYNIRRTKGNFKSICCGPSRVCKKNGDYKSRYRAKDPGAVNGSTKQDL